MKARHPPKQRAADRAVMLAAYEKFALALGNCTAREEALAKMGFCEGWIEAKKPLRLETKAM